MWYNSVADIIDLSEKVCCNAFYETSLSAFLHFSRGGTHFPDEPFFLHLKFVQTTCFSAFFKKNTQDFCTITLQKPCENHAKILAFSYFGGAEKTTHWGVWTKQAKLFS